MVNYSNGKIYKIEPTCDHDECEIYVGSTAQKYLSDRFAQHNHKYMSENKHKYGKYSSFKLFDKYGFDNCKITLIEAYPCSNKEELNKREGHFQRNMKCINVVMIGRTKSEYYQDNIDKFKKLHKQYVEDHKEDVKVYQDQYRIDNREELLAGKKAHYQANRERLLKQQKAYKDKNRDIVRAKANEKIACECGCFVTRSSISTHRKNTKHKAEMEKLNAQNNETI